MRVFQYLCMCISILASCAVGATWQEFTGRSFHQALDLTSQELEQKHGLKVVAFSERVNDAGHPYRIGISLEGCGCHGLEGARALLLDCTAVTQKHLDSVISQPLKDLSVTIYFNDKSGSPSLEPYISVAELNQTEFDFCWQTAVDQKDYSRQVKEPR